MQSTMPFQIPSVVTAMLSHFPQKFLSSTHYLMVFRLPDGFIPLCNLSPIEFWILRWIFYLPFRFVRSQCQWQWVRKSDRKWKEKRERIEERGRWNRWPYILSKCKSFAFEKHYAKALYEREAFLFVSHLTMCLHIINLLDAKTKTPFSAHEWHK